MVILAAALLALSLAFPEGGKAPVEDSAAFARYCNPVFRFCVKYPESLLPHQQVLPDSSGIGLQPYDRSALVTVRGDRQAAGKTPRTYFAEQLDALTPLQGQLSLLDTLYGDDYYEAYFTWQTESIFHQAFFFDEYCVIMIARVPTNRPILLKQIREEVKLEFENR
ncbi:MAG: hypothetical protein CMN32_04530 [Saprospirales bacterium]|nr:hypothetical protein [Saprospirales bacterium]